MDDDYVDYETPKAISAMISMYKDRGLQFQKTGRGKTQRNELMKQIHDCYIKDKWLSDRANCAKWLSIKRLSPTKENVDVWKKQSGEYYKPITPASLASFWLGHIKTEDLFYIVSIAKDKINRKENFVKWLFWSLRAEKN